MLEALLPSNTNSSYHSQAELLRVFLYEPLWQVRSRNNQTDHFEMSTMKFAEINSPLYGLTVGEETDLDGILGDHDLPQPFHERPHV